MMSKFIVFSDPHYKFNYGKSKLLDGGITSWLRTQLDLTEFIFNYAIENGITTVINDGDMFEEKNRISFTLYNAVWELYRSYSKKLNIIFNTGNHDISTVTGVSTAKPFSDIITVIDEVTTIDDMVFVPHGKLDQLDVTGKILFTHEDYEGLVYENSTGDEKGYDPNLIKNWDIVFNGHVHKPQQLKNIYNIGSMTVGDWGEENDTKRFLLYNDGDVLSVNLNNPKFYSFSKLDEKVRKAINDTDYFRVDVSSEEITDPIFQKYNVDYIIVRSSERKLRLDSKLSKEDEIKVYVDGEDTNLDKERLVKIGLELLKGDE